MLCQPPNPVQEEACKRLTGTYADCETGSCSGCDRVCLPPTSTCTWLQNAGWCPEFLNPSSTTATREPGSKSPQTEVLTILLPSIVGLVVVVSLLVSVVLILTRKFWWRSKEVNREPEQPLVRQPVAAENAHPSPNGSRSPDLPRSARLEYAPVPRAVHALIVPLEDTSSLEQVLARVPVTSGSSAASTSSSSNQLNLAASSGQGTHGVSTEQPAAPMATATSNNPPGATPIPMQDGVNRAARGGEVSGDNEPIISGFSIPRTQ